MEIYVIIVFWILGTCIGSFLNVVIDRLPAGKSLVYPPSGCDACQHRLSWPDLFPVFSFLFLRGRCRYCQAKIPQRVFWVELGTGLLVAFLYWFFGWKPILPVVIVYCSVLIVIAIIDLKHQLIFNIIVFPAAVIALIVNFFVPDVQSFGCNHMDDVISFCDHHSGGFGHFFCFAFSISCTGCSYWSHVKRYLGYCRQAVFMDCFYLRDEIL